MKNLKRILVENFNQVKKQDNTQFKNKIVSVKIKILKTEAYIDAFYLV